MESLIKNIRSFTALSSESEKALLQILETKKYTSGTMLCKIDEYPDKVYFLKSGYVRGFAYSGKGTTYNRAIYSPNEFMASLSALILDKKALLALECLTDIETIEAEYDDFLKLGEKNVEIAQIYTKVLEELFIKMENTIIQMATMNATERYLALRKRIPKIDQYISQYHIASHLGITPIQLSRIRKGLLSSK